MFKGVFFQHLGYFLEDLASLEQLQGPTKQALLHKYSDFIHANAYSVWEVARGEDGKIGNWWAATPGDQARQQVSVETHGSGVAAVTCAVRLDKLLESLGVSTDGSN